MKTAYERFFGYFGLRENPFHVSPDPKFYVSTPAHEAAFAELVFGLQTKQGMAVLTGEAGTGKTTQLNRVLEWLHERKMSSAYVFHALLEPIELIEFIIRDFGITHTATRKGDLIAALHNWLIERDEAGDSPVVILDEAQALPTETLDELRLLLNLETPRGKLVQIILAGQPELEEKLKTPELRQLRQRVMFHCRLTTLSEEQADGYIRARLAAAGCQQPDVFPLETVHEIHRCSKGIPRVVNLLCEHALITAYGENQKVITPAIVRRIAGDFGMIPVAEEQRSKPVQSRFAGISLDTPGPATPAPVIPPAPVRPSSQEPARAMVAYASAGGSGQTRTPSTPPAPQRIPAPQPGARTSAAEFGGRTAVLKSSLSQQPRIAPKTAPSVGPRMMGVQAMVAALPHNPKRAPTPVPRPFVSNSEGTQAELFTESDHRGTRAEQDDAGFAEVPRYWRRSGARNSWQAKSGRFFVGLYGYGREIVESFIVDCRRVGRFLAAPMPAAVLPQADVNSENRKTWHAPATDWLRRPIETRNAKNESVDSAQKHEQPAVND